MEDVQTSHVNAILAPLNIGPWNFVCSQFFKGQTTFNKTIFIRNQKYERGGRLKIKIRIFIYEDDFLNFRYLINFLYLINIWLLNNVTH
jgi:hypothetical protein